MGCKFRPRWSVDHFLRVLGAILDATGVIMIAVAVVQIESNELDAADFEQLENQLNAERDEEGRISVYGVFFIAAGFLCLMTAEIMSWVMFSCTSDML